MQITPSTTLQQLEVEKARLGITQLFVIVSEGGEPYHACYAETADGRVVGGHETMAGAIADAFEKITAKLGEILTTSTPR